MSRTLSVVYGLGLVLHAACGGGGGGVDARILMLPDGTPDAPRVMGPDAPPGYCDYGESADVGNASTAESTGLAVGPEGVRLCGQIDPAAGGSGGVVDADTYLVGVPGGRYILRSTYAADSGIETFLFSPDDFFRGGFGTGWIATEVAAADGALRIVASATAALPPADVVPYEITIMPDPFEQRCPARTGTADYVEAHDGGDNGGNDVVSVRHTNNFGVGPTAVATDAAEPTGLVVDDASTFLITGDLGAHTASGDDYLDRDTFAVTTGPAQHTITVRLDWIDGADASDDANVDLEIFRATPEGAPVKERAASWAPGHTGPEFETFAVEPSATYWLWVGNHNGPGAPKAYALTLCGASPPDLAP